jgi:CHAT domain-containing protein
MHAAGLYGEKNQPKIFNYVVSSCTPTLTALLSAKRPLARCGSGPRILAVSQPATPRQQPLPGTVREVGVIQTIQATTRHFPITRLNDREATVAAVLQGMKECNWIHLACHGVQDAASPTNSAFLLIDNPLTLREIMKQSFTHTELAVLSACQTAKGDSELPEEAIHLAAGMLMAGYGSVVGTMWSIRDDDGPIIAEKFYKYLIEEADGDSSRAAYALHDAVARLRDIRGENDFASWVPFTHLGVCLPLSE